MIANKRENKIMNSAEVRPFLLMLRGKTFNTEKQLFFFSVVCSQVLNGVIVTGIMPACPFHQNAGVEGVY